MRLRTHFQMFFMVFLFLPAYVHSAVRVKSFIQPTALSPQDNLTLTVEVESESLVQISAPRLPALNAFNLVSQNQSHQIHILNGKRTHKKQYQYALKPKREGTFRIGSIEVVVDGKAYKTSPLEEIQVSSKIQPKPKSRRSSPFGWGRKGLSPFFSDPFFEESAISEKDIFLKLETDKTKAYVGEMIVAEWFFYFPAGSSYFNSEVTKSPSLNGFWVESVFQLGASSPSPPQRTRVKGRPYVRQKLIANALFPLQPGSLTVGALKANNWPSGFKAFFGGPPKPILKESNTQSITVIPLPKEGRGKLWTSAVGDFVVSAHLSKDIISAEDPVVYKVHFKGTGQVRGIRLPKLDFGPDFNVYDITETQQFLVSESQKTYEVILLPNRAGDLQTPAFELSTFDPGLGVYKTHVLPSLKLKVKGVILPSVNKNKSEKYFAEEKGIQDPKSGRSLPQKLIPWVEGKPGVFFEYRKIFWLFIYGFLALFFVLSLCRMVFFKKSKKSFLSKEVRDSLKQAELSIKQKNWKLSGRLLQQAMSDFFTALAGQDVAVKNWSVLLKKLPLSVRIKYEDSIRSLVFQLEKLSFAPEAEAKDLQNQKHLFQLKKELSNMMVKINKELRPTDSA